jgi:hypothetical protein
MTHQLGLQHPSVEHSLRQPPYPDYLTFAKWLVVAFVHPPLQIFQTWQ